MKPLVEDLNFAISCLRVFLVFYWLSNLQMQGVTKEQIAISRHLASLYSTLCLTSQKLLANIFLKADMRIDFRLLRTSAWKTLWSLSDSFFFFAIDLLQPDVKLLRLNIFLLQEAKTGSTLIILLIGSFRNITRSLGLYLWSKQTIFLAREVF